MLSSKRILAALLLVLMASPVLASVQAVGNGSISVPVSCANGGTGLSSGTIGQIPVFTATCTIGTITDVATGQVLVSGGVGAVPVYTAAPTISGANITSATIPAASINGGANQTTCTTWTPADASGASLVITVGGAIYCHTNNSDGSHMTMISVNITYPSTASASTAMITLPFNSSTFASFAIGYTTLGLPILAFTNTGLSSFDFANTSGSVYTNVALSGKQIYISGTYQSST
jgi:hypothetical protein